ncbi:MAG: M28 family peptidase [Acidobacteria bacterium]|nr:M28 family peptidase [Acidobacteriota bacterium]
MQTAQSRRGVIAATIAVLAGLVVTSSGQAPPDRCLVPPAIRDAILNEYSGEQARLHVQMLSANRDRAEAEYTGNYFESDYISAEARRYGLSDVRVDTYPAGDEWDAEEGDLWLVQPVQKKIASVNQVATSLAKGSVSADVEAEMIYVGAGREADYAGKDVAGKIVFGTTGVGQVFNNAVNQKGAAGALGTGSAGVSENSAGFTLDQLGWSSVQPRTERGGFGFVLSIRQMLELQSYVERGQKVVMRAHVRTRRYPSKMNVVSAIIPGSDPAAAELLTVAHAFETIATPGANDNCSGVGTTMEVARTLARLIRDGALPQPRRTLRFLWVPEISGSRAYMFQHPELEGRLLAAMNYDMPGTDLEKTDSYLRMKMTPDSVPSFLNDLVANLLQFVDQTEIRTPTGNNAPFNYRLVPYIANSDHMVFLAAGIPAMQFNHWPDNFYHSSADTVEMTDATETKRIGFVGASAFYYLATAGPAEAKALAWESTANGAKWISEVARQSIRLLGRDAAKLPDQYAAVQNKIAGAFQRARGGVTSALTVASDASVQATVKAAVAGLEGVRNAEAGMVEAVFKSQAAALGIKPVVAVPSLRAQELALLVPVKKFKTFSDEARKLAERQQAEGRGGGRGGAPGAGGGRSGGGGLSGLASFEVSGFIDGTRSILDIYNAVRAEYGNVTTSTNDFKFAWVVGAEYPDIDLEAVATAITDLEKAGAVEIRKAEVKGSTKK